MKFGDKVKVCPFWQFGL